MPKKKSEKALSYAHRLFTVRARSESELKDRLFRKGFDRDTIQSVISRLKDKNIINDERFARLWVESRMRTSPRGAILLRRELIEKGVPSSVIEGALLENREPEDRVAKRLAERKIKSLRGIPKIKAKRRLFDYLKRKGIKFDIIEEILTEFLN